VDTGFRERSCSSNKLKRDDDSKKSRHALGDRGELKAWRRIRLCARAGRPGAGARYRSSERSYGGPTQTWEDIERARQEIQRQIAIEYHLGDPAKPAAPAIKRRSAHRHPDPH
jgi:hypothetical protein